MEQLNRLEKEGKDVWDRLKEYLKMHKYARVRIVEKAKRAEPVEVTSLIKPFSVEDVFKWVCNNIKYRREAKDFWQLPSETLKRKRGDCEDGALLLASLFCSILPKSEWWRVFVAVYAKPAHVVVVYRGMVYDWTQKQVFPLSKVPDWRLWYMFNFRHAYTTKENVKKWLDA